MGLFDTFLRTVSDQVFTRVDYNGDGMISAAEIEIGTLKIYNMINKRLPGFQDPPEIREIQEALLKHDLDHNNALDKDEFFEFARGIINCGPDAFLSRIGKDAVMKAGVVPALTQLALKYAGGNKIKGVDQVPLAVLAPVLGSLMGGLKGILPVP